MKKKKLKAQRAAAPVSAREISPRLMVAVSALAAIVPLFACWPQFSELFYFHDDFTLLYELSNTTLPLWIVHPFVGESIVPLFKLLWIAVVWISGGSYLALIVIQWLTHVGICLTLGWLLLRLRFEAAAAAFAVLTFGLPSSNVETLGWSMQWCSQLSLLFFLLAWHALLTIVERPVGWAWRAWYASAIVASALCSSRGIVSGLILAFFLVLGGEWRKRIRLIAISVAPTVLLVLATALYVPAFRQSNVGHVTYSLNYLARNPLSSLIPWIPPVGGVWIFGMLKIAVIAWAFYKSDRRLYPFLAALVAFDAATAAALGYARTWTGLSTTVSSRYQYIPLLVFGPMLGILVAGWRRELRIVAFAVWIVLLTYRWGGTMDNWARWRGTQIRVALERGRPYLPFDPSRLTIAEGRRLIERYGLH